MTDLCVFVCVLSTYFTVGERGSGIEGDLLQCFLVTVAADGLGQPPLGPHAVEARAVGDGEVLQPHPRQLGRPPGLHLLADPVHGSQELIANKLT